MEHHDYPHEPGMLPGCPPCDLMLDCPHEDIYVEGPDESVGLFGTVIECQDCGLRGDDLLIDTDPDGTVVTVHWENGTETPNALVHS